MGGLLAVGTLSVVAIRFHPYVPLDDVRMKYRGLDPSDVKAIYLGGVYTRNRELIKSIVLAFRDAEAKQYFGFYRPSDFAGQRTCVIDFMIESRTAWKYDDQFSVVTHYTGIENAYGPKVARAVEPLLTWEMIRHARRLERLP